MVEHQCKICKKVFNKKSSFLRHVNRKKSCNPDQSYTCNKCNKSFKTKQEYDRHINRKNPCYAQISTVKKKEDYSCHKCKKSFSSYDGLYYHIKNSVCDKDPLMIIQKNINSKVSKISNPVKIDKQVNVGVGVDGDVKVVKFGNENLDHISDDLYKQILGRGMRSIEEFINHSNFHPDHPENHNIYIANIRDVYVVLYDGFKWSITDRDELMEDIIYAKSDYLLIKFNELSHEMDPRDVFKFENFMKRRDDDDVLRKIKGELTLQFYNNRYLPQRQRKRMELIENKKIRDSISSSGNLIVRELQKIMDSDIDKKDIKIKIQELLDSVNAKHAPK